MLLKLLSALFGRLIGSLPAEQREPLREEFHAVLAKAVGAAAEGAVRGLRR